MNHASSHPWIAITHRPPASLERGERSFVARTPIDMDIARAQHRAYCTVLADCGARVTTLGGNAAYADGVFVEDTAVVLDEVAIITRPGAASRQGETAAIERELTKYREIRRIEAPATLDGGDVVVTNRTILVGASARSNQAGADALAALTAPFGYHVRRVGLHGCLHLKSACCALPDGRFLVNPLWLDTEALAGEWLLNIAPEEPFAADFATVGATVVVSASNPRTAQMIRDLGFAIRITPLSEFEKAEGGVSCLSLVFREVGPR